MDVSTCDDFPRAHSMGGERSHSPTRLKEPGRQTPCSEVLGQRQPQAKQPGLQPGPWLPSFQRTRASSPDARGRIMCSQSRSRSRNLLKDPGRQPREPNAPGQRQPRPKRPGLQRGPRFPSCERIGASAPDALARIMDPNFPPHHRAGPFVVGGVEPPPEGRSLPGLRAASSGAHRPAAEVDVRRRHLALRGSPSRPGLCGASTSTQSAGLCGRLPRSPGVRALHAAPVTPPEILERWPVVGPDPARAFMPHELLMLPAPYAPVCGRAPITPEELRHPALPVGEKRAFTPEELRMPPAPCARIGD
jgi:hypothetical protein